MDSRNKDPENPSANHASEFELDSPFLGEVLTAAQSPELELMEAESGMLVQESSFLNSVENRASSLDEDDIEEYERLADDFDDELEDDFFNNESETLDSFTGEMEFLEEYESEELDSFLADEADDEWVEEYELEADENAISIYETAASNTENEYSENYSDREFYLDENEMDFEEADDEHGYDEMESEHLDHDDLQAETADFEFTNEFELESFEDEFELHEIASKSNDGLSSIAIQAEKQWNASKDRPAKWINNVHGLVVHTTGGSLPGKAVDKGIYPTVYAINWYTRGNKRRSFHGGCHYVNGWQGIKGGDLFQIANEREKAYGVGTRKQRRSISKGNFEKDLPAQLLKHWKRRWPGYKDSLDLLPAGERYVNSSYVHVECTPVVYYVRDKRRRQKRTVISSEHPPMRAGLRFTKAQHDAIAYLACDIAMRNGWPLDIDWWRTTRLVGHEDLTPISRKDIYGGYDPGYLRDKPFFDWDYVYDKIKTIKAGGYKLPGSQSSSPGGSTAADLIQGVKNKASNLYQIAKLFHAARLAISKGERNENKLTNIVFYTKHRNRKGIKLKRNDPLAKDWLNIRKNIVRPLLGRINKSQDSNVIDSDNDQIISASKLGYVEYSNGDKKRITPEAVVWLAKMIDAETWGKPTEDDARSMLWALVQRTAIWRFRKWNWVKMIQAYSQPINPRWTRSGKYCHKYYKSSYRGSIPQRCSVRRVNRRAQNIRMKWEDVHPIARKVVLEFVAGKIPNHIPGAVGWFAPGTWRSRERNGSNKKSNMVFHSTIDGNVYFAMNRRPDTTDWTAGEVVIRNR